MEAAIIDLIGLENLTNQVAGYHSGSFGRINSQDLILMLTAKPVRVVHKAILITINKLYLSNMPALELYGVTRGIWRVNKSRAEKVEYALAVYQGIVREVYRVEKWHPAGILPYQTREKFSEKEKIGRWEFSGQVAEPAIREKYVGFSVGKSGQNPIRYMNV